VEHQVVELTEVDLKISVHRKSNNRSYQVTFDDIWFCGCNCGANFVLAQRDG
jgi:hypothetical protein